MRGGGPHQRGHMSNQPRSSPHARGWSRGAWGGGEHCGVFPACAGVVPMRGERECDTWCLPRMRGGGPTPAALNGGLKQSSPHARGWSRSVADMIRSVAVFPACAGVVPVPHQSSWPGHGLPRMRGGGPYRDQAGTVHPLSSPHARGWSHS